MLAENQATPPESRRGYGLARTIGIVTGKAIILGTAIEALVDTSSSLGATATKLMIGIGAGALLTEISSEPARN